MEGMERLEKLEWKDWEWKDWEWRTIRRPSGRRPVRWPACSAAWRPPARRWSWLRSGRNAHRHVGKA